jgi:Skp family chaperone for outer membrane proteins
MKLVSKLIALTAFLAVFAVPSFAQAQKFAVANMGRIMTEIKEFKDLEGKLKGRFDEAKRQQESLQARARELQGQRDQFKVGSPEYERANNDLIKLAVEAQVAGQIAQQELIREQKRHLRALSEKIVTQVQTIAQSKQLALVISQVVPAELALTAENWEKLTPEQASQVLSQRNLLFVSPDLDITNEIITALDASYASGK